MDKFLKLGEQYIQWVALGLGVVWLGLMAYLYLLQPPITVDVGGGAPKDPGEVDAYLLPQLKNVSDQVNAPESKITYGPMNPAEEFRVAVAGTPPIEVAINHNPTPGPEKGPNKPAATTQPTLVSVPAAIQAKEDPSVGTSNISLPQQPTAAAASAQPVLAQVDRDWVSLLWRVRMDALNKAFEAAHIPPEKYRVLPLKVELYRQEISPSGQPVSGPVLVAQELLGDTEPTPKWPAENASNDEKWQYITWAAQKWQSILEPPFPGVTLGTPFYMPGDPKPQDSFNAAPAAPVAPVPTIPFAPPVVGPVGPAQPPGMPNRPAPAGVRGIPGVGAGPRGPIPPYPFGGRGYPYPGAYPRPAVAPGAPAPAPAPVPGRPNELAFPEGGTGGEAVDFPGGFDPAQAAQAPPPAPAAPAAPGAPAAQAPQAPTMPILTHDWTVQAGKTYRYQVRYWLANPLFLTTLAGKDVVNKWAIESPASPWSRPVSVPSRYEFFVQKVQGSPTNTTRPVEVYFDVFTKKPDAPGGLTKDSIRLTPGDPIGGSGSILVDVHADPKNRQQVNYVLVSDPSGRVERRDLESDKASDRHKELNERVGTASAAP